MEFMASMVIPVLESRDWDTNCLTMNVFKGNYTIQWNLNLVTTFDLATIFQKPFFNLLSERRYRGSPDSTNFGPPGDRTIAKIVLSGD